MVVVERDEERDSTASVAILSTVGSSEAFGSDGKRGKILESSILIAGCWMLALYILKAGL
jgi:hypothetical protein